MRETQELTPPPPTTVQYIVTRTSSRWMSLGPRQTPSAVTRSLTPPSTKRLARESELARKEELTTHTHLRSDARAPRVSPQKRNQPVSSEDDRVYGTDAGAGQHGHHQLEGHGHVHGHAIALENKKATSFTMVYC